MIFSQKIERQRRFKLALRAALLPLMLIGLIIYNFISKDSVHISTQIVLLSVAIVFIVVYFIFFILELATNDNLVDLDSCALNEPAFIAKTCKKHTSEMALIEFGNFDVIEEFYAAKDINKMLKSFVLQLDMFLSKNGFKNIIIGRNSHNRFIISVITNSHNTLNEAIANFIQQAQKIESIEIEYSYATTPFSETYEKTLLHLKNILTINQSSSNGILQKELDIKEIEKATVTALKKKNLIFTYKPLLNIKENRVDIYEVLVKLKANNSEDLIPKYYLPILNSLGLSREYDLTIAQHIIYLLESLDEHISLAFNLSPFSLRDENFQNELFTMLQKTKIDPKRVIIQLYEKKTHHDLSGYLKTLESIRDKGIRICIDNFGSSNASFDYLRHFNFDIIEFDRDFTQNIYNNNTDTILKSMLEFSKKSAITTVMKWIDQPAQKETFASFGVDYMQGFAIGKQLNENDLTLINSKA